MESTPIDTSDAKEEEFPVGTFTESAPTMPGGGITIPSMGALSGMLKQLGPEQKKKLTEVAKTLMKQQVLSALADPTQKNEILDVLSKNLHVDKNLIQQVLAQPQEVNAAEAVAQALNIPKSAPTTKPLTEEEQRHQANKAALRQRLSMAKSNRTKKIYGEPNTQMRAPSPMDVRASTQLMDQVASQLMDDPDKFLAFLATNGVGEDQLSNILKTTAGTLGPSLTQEMLEKMSSEMK